MTDREDDEQLGGAPRAVLVRQASDLLRFARVERVLGGYAGAPAGAPARRRRHRHALAVAEEGGFTRASDRLHVVQSAVSAGVRKLEQELGVTRFDRSTHRVRLSDAGPVPLPEARRTPAAAAPTSP